MIGFVLRLIAAGLADWLCHKINPRWRLQRSLTRAQKRLILKAAVDTSGITRAIDNLGEITLGLNR